MNGLQTKITNEAYVLYEALVDLVSGSAEKVTHAIEIIENYFLDLEEAATEINNACLPTICQQLRQNLIQLPLLAPTKRIALIRQFERWPRLISNYLYSPSEANHHLIDFLSDAQWPQPYPFDFAKKLCDSLSQELTHQKTNLKNPMSDLSKKIIEMSETLSAALNQLVTFDSESETYIEGLEQYTDTVQSFWELADKMDLKGIQDICLFINDNVFELYSQRKKQHQELFALWPKRLLEYLQVQEIGHQNPTLDALKRHDLAAEKLLELLRLDSWPVVMSKAKASLLLSQLIQDNRAFMTRINQSNDAPTVNENSDMAPPLESQKEPFDLQIANFDATVSSIVQTEAPLINRSSEALVYHAIENELELETLDASDTFRGSSFCAQKLEPRRENRAVSFPIHKELLVEENVAENGGLTAKLPRPSVQREQNIENENTIEDESTLTQLPLNNEENHKNLPAYDKELAVCQPDLFIDDKELADCQPDLFTDDDKELADCEPDLFIDDKELVDCEPKKWADATLPVLEPEMTDKELAGLLNNAENDHHSEKQLEQEEFLMTSKALAADSEEFVTDQTLAFESVTFEKEVTDQSPQPGGGHAQEFEATSEKLEQNTTDSNANFQLLIPKINESENARLIEELIAAEAGSEALLEAVMSYTENVQVFWEAAEQAGFSGVNEVCTFINDNIMALGFEPVSRREAARSVLSAWPQLMVAYLQAPQTGSEALVNNLQNAGWSAPLDEANALILKENLIAIQPRSTDVQSPIASKSFESLTDDISESQGSKQEVMPYLEVTIPNAQLLIEKINELAQENAQIIENLIAAEDGSEALLEAVMSYTEYVQILWEEAEQAGLDGLTEVC
ncbi:MAG: hypothetical protein DRR00_06335, partial [Candidatus Parabeggiatoa sp. nov. 3]